MSHKSLHGVSRKHSRSLKNMFIVLMSHRETVSEAFTNDISLY